jgi:hypothetical protein
VVELGSGDVVVRKIARTFKETCRIRFRDLLKRVKIDDAEGLATPRPDMAVKRDAFFIGDADKAQGSVYM